jgi:molecular chaperone HtpG
MESEERKYQIELTGLITLLAKHLYSNPDVFLREMVQNAHDSIVARRELQPSDAPAPRIEIGVDRSARTLTVSDNGRGLTRTEIIDHLATIGRSGTGELRANFEDRGQAVSLIGQFGIGLLSGFIVADNIIVETRSQDDAPLRWRSDGSEQYTIEAGIRDEVGTTLTLHLRQDQDRYLDPVTIRMLVRRYADFIGVPIHVAGDEHPTNAVDAPWHRPNQAHQSSARALEFWFTRFPHERPLHVFSADEPFDMPTADGRARTGHVRGVLAISDRVVLDASAMGTADLYVQRMFVGEANRDILPPWRTTSRASSSATTWP